MAQREQVFVGQPPIFGGSRLLPSPSQFFLTGEDRLRVVCVNSRSGVALRVQWRTARPDGSTVPNSETTTPTSDRTTNTNDFELGEGSLLNVTVYASAGAPMTGQTFVIVHLVRGVGAAAIVLGTILAGYVTAIQALGFPGSPIVNALEGEPNLRTLAGTQPAVGGFISEAVPTGARWEIVSWFCTFQTSGVGITRYVATATYTSGVILQGIFLTTNTQAGGILGQYTFGPNLPFANDNTNAAFQSPLPSRMLLAAGAIITTSAYNLQGGDQFSAPRFTVREWLEVG